MVFSWRFYAKCRVLNKLIIPGSVFLCPSSCLFSENGDYTSIKVDIWRPTLTVHQFCRRQYQNTTIIPKIKIFHCSLYKNWYSKWSTDPGNIFNLCVTVLNRLNISGNKEGQLIFRAMSLVISRAIIDSLKVNAFVCAIGGYDPLRHM
jgi:hypothetical protein